MDYHIATGWVVVLAILAVWELVWKGLALWRASHRSSKIWFTAILVLNTAGILPITYMLITNGLNMERKE